jgi:hypothetical protein
MGSHMPSSAFANRLIITKQHIKKEILKDFIRIGL